MKTLVQNFLVKCLIGSKIANLFFKCEKKYTIAIYTILFQTIIAYKDMLSHKYIIINVNLF